MKQRAAPSEENHIAMCYFLTIGLPEERAPFFESRIPRGLHIAPMANASVLQQMGRGIRAYLLTSGGCSCDLFHEPTNDARRDSRHERLRQKYEKQGWSAAKIDRALAQRPKDARPTSFVGLRGDVQRLLGELAPHIGRVAIVVHWYDDDLRESVIACTQGKVVPSEQAMEENLQITADEIVWVRALR